MWYIMCYCSASPLEEAVFPTSLFVAKPLIEWSAQCRDSLQWGPGAPVGHPCGNWLCLLVFWGCLASVPAVQTDNRCSCSFQWIKVKAVLIALASILLHETCISDDHWPISNSLFGLPLGNYRLED